MRGYAIATARAVVRVDVSTEWRPHLDAGGARARSRTAPWSWTFWTAALDLPKGEHELASAPGTRAGQTQPALPDDTWNFKGYLSAAWHRVLVSVS